VGVERPFYITGWVRSYVLPVQADQSDHADHAIGSLRLHPVLVNGGTVQNRGFELSVNAVPIRTKDFSWNILLNWSKNNNKVLSLYGGQPSYTIASYQNSSNWCRNGEIEWYTEGYGLQYVNGQRLIDANGYPVKSTNTKSDIGDINPDWLGASPTASGIKIFLSASSSMSGKAGTYIPRHGLCFLVGRNS